MASKECLLLSVLAIFVIGLILVGITNKQKSLVPCYFIFGDSLSDTGNNNYLNTSIKADFTPYGINFLGGATGRFTHGRTMHDFISESFGILQFIPPFAEAHNNESVNVMQGVNYASGWAGIRDETGQRMGERIPLNEQLRNHKIIMSRISKKMGDSAAKKHLSKCIYSLQIGGNDYTDNFFQPDYYNTSHQYNEEQYAEALVQQYSQQIKSLHEDGARMFAVFGLEPIGCTTNSIQIYGRDSSGCVLKLNQAAELFNGKLEAVVDELNKNLSYAELRYLNPTPPGTFEMNGVMELEKTCCETEYGSKTSGRMLCRKNSKACNNPEQHLYWDGHHHTELWNKLSAKVAFEIMRTFVPKK